MSKYYVYALLDTRKPLRDEIDGFPKMSFVPFYIGKGKNKRKEQHLKNKSDKNLAKQNKIAKIRKEGFEPISVILFENMREEEVSKATARRKYLEFQETQNKMGF